MSYDSPSGEAYGRSARQADPPDARSARTGAGSPTPRSARLASYRRPDREDEAVAYERRNTSSQVHSSAFGHAPHSQAGRDPAPRDPAPRGAAAPPAPAPRQRPSRQKPRGAGQRPQARSTRTARSRRPGTRPARSASSVALSILGGIVAIFLALGSAVAGLVSRIFGRSAPYARHVYGSKGRRPRNRISARYGSTSRWGGRGAPAAFRLPIVLGSALCGALVLCLLSTIVAVTPAGADAASEASMLNLATRDAGQLPASTPRESWRQGSMPYFFQTDPAWAQKPYGGDTIAVNGCGPTCLAMVYVYVTGKTDMTPADMGAFADAGNYAPTGATEWRFMSEGAAQLGLVSSELATDREAILAALRSGQPVICAVNPGDFTAVGHFIVLASVDENDMVSVHDPNSSYRSAQKWSIDRIVMQTSACWTYTA